MYNLKYVNILNTLFRSNLKRINIIGIRVQVQRLRLKRQKNAISMFS